MARVEREDLKRRVREANDIVDVVGAVVQLKRAGKSYKALCPFHNEKTASFTVSPERQTFKCFGCGEGGDVFSFVEKYDRVDFKEALSVLAERAGIPLVYTRESREAATRAAEQKRHLYRAQTLAASFFVERLASPEGKAAREYIASRGLGELAADWELGYAPDRWDGLTGKYATSPPKERLLVAAGLARERDSGGVYDVFRGRLMFPIRDTQGRAVGFGGRILGDGEPKYLNTPETAVFVKGRLLYGLDRARGEIGKSAEAIVVEGYTDVMRCHEHGFTNAVATLGTALGADHLRLLRRMGAKRIVLVYDTDAAGMRASERGTPTFLEEDMVALLGEYDSESCAVALLEGGQDPCEFLAERGPEAFRQALDRAADVFDFKMEQVFGRMDRSDASAMANAAIELMELASLPKFEAQRWALRKRIVDRSGVPEDMLHFKEVRRRRPGDESAPDLSERPGGPEALDRRAERELAGLLLCLPEGFEIAREEAELGQIKDPLAREVVQAIEAALAGAARMDGKAGGGEGGNEAGKLDVPALLDRLTQGATAFAVDSLEANEGADPARLAERVRKAAVALWLCRARSRVEKLTLEIKTAEKKGDEERLAARLRERQDLVRGMHARKARSDPDARRRMEARRG